MPHLRIGRPQRLTHEIMRCLNPKTINGRIATGTNIHRLFGAPSTHPMEYRLAQLLSGSYMPGCVCEFVQIAEDLMQTRIEFALRQVPNDLRCGYGNAK